MQGKVTSLVLASQEGEQTYSKDYLLLCCAKYV